MWPNPEQNLHKKAEIILLMLREWQTYHQKVCVVKNPWQIIHGRLEEALAIVEDSSRVSYAKDHPRLVNLDTQLVLHFWLAWSFS